MTQKTPTQIPERALLAVSLLRVGLSGHWPGWTLGQGPYARLAFCRPSGIGDPDPLPGNDLISAVLIALISAGRSTAKEQLANVHISSEIRRPTPEPWTGRASGFESVSCRHVGHLPQSSRWNLEHTKVLPDVGGLSNNLGAPPYDAVTHTDM